MVDESGSVEGRTSEGSAHPADVPADAATPEPGPARREPTPEQAARIAAARARREARETKRERLHQRTTSQRYPAWGPSTLALLVTGVVVGYISLITIGRDVMHQCAAAPGSCNPRVQGLMLALPAVATAIGLAISVVGGRVLVGRDRSPMPAAKIGWAVFAVAMLVGLAAYLFGGPTG
jgi:hypothetical protein